SKKYSIEQRRHSIRLHAGKPLIFSNFAPNHANLERRSRFASFFNPPSPLQPPPNARIPPQRRIQRLLPLPPLRARFGVGGGELVRPVLRQRLDQRGGLGAVLDRLGASGSAAALGDDQLVHGEALRRRDLQRRAFAIERHGRNGIADQEVEVVQPL